MRNRHPMPVVLGSPLEQARAAFDSLTDGPNPVSVDGRAVPAMPPRPVRLDEVRNRLRERGCPAATRDAIWTFLVHRARTEAGVWTIACVGCALPVLVQASRRLCRSLPDTPPLGGPALRSARARSAVTGLPHRLRGAPTHTGAETGSGPGTGTGGAPPPAGTRGDAPWGRVHRAAAPGWVGAASAVDDVEAAVLAGFLGELAVIDLARPRVLARLRSAAHEAGALARREITGAPIPQAQLFACCSPPRSAQHPDLVLAHAVAAGAITRSEAALIGSTRLEPISLAQVAVARGQSYRDVRAARIRAERKLSVYLRDRNPGSIDVGSIDVGSIATVGRRTSSHRRTSARPAVGPQPSARVRSSAVARSSSDDPSSTGAECGVRAGSVPDVTQRRHVRRVSTAGTRRADRRPAAAASGPATLRVTDQSLWPPTSTSAPGETPGKTPAGDRWPMMAAATSPPRERARTVRRRIRRRRGATNTAPAPTTVSTPSPPASPISSVTPPISAAMAAPGPTPVRSAPVDPVRTAEPAVLPVDAPAADAPATDIPAADLAAAPAAAAAVKADIGVTGAISEGRS
jgi:hypothetical protein